MNLKNDEKFSKEFSGCDSECIDADERNQEVDSFVIDTDLYRWEDLHASMGALIQARMDENSNSATSLQVA